VNLSGAPRKVELDVAGLLGLPSSGGAKPQPLLGDAPASLSETGRLEWTLPPRGTWMLSLPGLPKTAEKE